MKYCPTCTLLFKEKIKHCPIDGDIVIDSNGHELQGKILHNRYKLIKMLGIGGMSYVYLAEHTSINRVVAVKFLFGDYVINENMVKRFHRETETLSQLHHVNCVTIIDVSPPEEIPHYFVMEYIQGSLLEEIVENEAPLEPLRALKIGIQICDALVAAHRIGIIHRDLKPLNIYLIPQASGDEVVKIVDFGLAILAWNKEEESRLTDKGVIFGTPEYLAPECAQGEIGNEQSDLYSLGIVLYEIFTGTLPFTSKSSSELIYHHINTPPPIPIITQLDGKNLIAIQSVILNALTKVPRNRYSSAEEMLEELKQCRELITSFRSLPEIYKPGDDSTTNTNIKIFSKPSNKIKIIIASIIIIGVILSLIGIYSVLKARDTLKNASYQSEDLNHYKLLQEKQSNQGNNKSIEIKGGINNKLMDQDSDLENQYNKTRDEILDSLSRKGITITDLLYFDQRIYGPWFEQSRLAQEGNFSEAQFELEKLRISVNSLDVQKLLYSKFKRIDSRFTVLKREIRVKQLKQITPLYNQIKNVFSKNQILSNEQRFITAKNIEKLSGMIEKAYKNRNIY